MTNNVTANIPESFEAFVLENPFSHLFHGKKRLGYKKFAIFFEAVNVCLYASDESPRYVFD